MSDSEAALPRLMLFAGLDLQIIRQLLGCGRKRTLAGKGELLSSDELSQRLYLLLDGQMKMLRPGGGGEETVQQRLTAGDVFCPVAMIAGRACCSYAESLGCCTLISWPHRTFLRFMAEQDQLSSNILTLLAHQIEDERQQRCLSQCAPVKTRIAAFLLARLERTAGRLCHDVAAIDVRPISLTAQELGIARETVSRTFSRFEQCGILHCRRGLIHICDSERLRRIADGSDTDSP